MILTIYTIIHVLISLAGIVSGFLVLFGLLAGKHPNHWTGTFLATTVATSVTGFGFPVHHFMPSHAVGILSLVILALAIYALYSRHLSGAWAKVYVIGAVTAFYFNVFVGIVQAFQKIPALRALAPTQTEPAFKFTQLTVLILFIAAGIIAASRSRSEPVSVS